MPEGERDRLERYPEFAPVGVARPPARRPSTSLSGGETIEVAGISFECLAVPGHSPAHVAFYADGELFSGDLLFAGSVGRVDLPGADWDTLLASVRMLAERLPPETVVHPGHGPETTLGVELARNPFLAELRAEAEAWRRSEEQPGKFQAPRGTHDVLPRDHLWWRVIRTIEEQCAQYGWSRVSTPGFEETALFERTSGEASDVVHKEMYTFEDRGDRSLTLRPGGDGADRARVRRARSRAGAAAGEGVHDRADVPLRRGRAAAATASTGSCRSRRSARPIPPSTPR